MTNKKKTYKVVNFVDVNELLSFVKKEYKELGENVKEEKRVEDELLTFINSIEKHSGHVIHHIGHEKKEGVHLVKFLFKDGGFLEVFVNKPLTINGHFVSHRAAEKFAHGLKKALHGVLPDTPIKSMYLDSVKIEDGLKDEILTMSKWKLMHAVAVVHKTVLVAFITSIIFLTVEFAKDFFKETVLDLTHKHTLLFAVTIAVLFSFVFEPLKETIEQIIEHTFFK